MVLHETFSYLSDDVVEAWPASTGYRLRKFVARNQGKVTAASLVLMSAVGRNSRNNFGTD